MVARKWLYCLSDRWIKVCISFGHQIVCDCVKANILLFGCRSIDTDLPCRSCYSTIQQSCVWASETILIVLLLLSCPRAHIWFRSLRKQWECECAIPHVTGGKALYCEWIVTRLYMYQHMCECMHDCQTECIIVARRHTRVVHCWIFIYMDARARVCVLLS